MAGITLALSLYGREHNKMKTIYEVICNARLSSSPIAAMLWHRSVRSFRMPSTSSELLDLFEEQRRVQDEVRTMAPSSKKRMTL
jgi:hypothetical protein